jgi:uncharacterized protein YwqG
MDGLPIEIQNKIWNLYYKDIYYTNVTSILNEKIAICNKINNSKDSLENCYSFDNLSSEIGFLKYFNQELSKIYQSDEVKRRLFQISFHNFGKIK